MTRTLSYVDAPDPALLGRGGSTYFIVGIEPSDGSGAALVARLRAATSATGRELQETQPALELAWTGEDALDHDLRAASAANVARAERHAIP